MKKLIFTNLILLCFLVVRAQLPTIHGYTVIPANPTTNDYVKIVTHVSTPNLGIAVDIISTVTAMPNQIKLHGCYWQGMLTAIQNHIDTFYIGYLNPGPYTVKHSVYLSSTQQHCSRIDSNFATNQLVVSGNVSVKDLIKDNEVHVFPNPAVNYITLQSKSEIENLSILNLEGRCVYSSECLKTDGIEITALPAGVYLVRYSVKDKPGLARFIRLPQ